MKKRYLLLAVSLLLLGVLWWKTGWRELWDVCRSSHGGWLAATLLMFVPQTLLSGWRWAWMVRAYQPLSGWQATELVLASSTLNVVLPSKMGDVLKGMFLRRDLPGGDATIGLMLAFFEKGLDTAALAAVMIAATIVAPPTQALGWFLVTCGGAGVGAFLVLLTRPAAAFIAKAARVDCGPKLVAKLLHKFGAAGDVILQLRSQPRRFALVLVSAVALWLLHLAQFSFALWAAGGTADTALLWSRVPMAIFVGLLPVSFAGVGTRDAAMLYLLGPRTGEGVALALGFFATLRYVVVALAGLPFILRLPLARALLGTRRNEANRWRLDRRYPGTT